MVRIHRRTIQKKKEKKKKRLSDSDNHSGKITHLVPNILECEVKWVLGSINMNKASRGDRIPAELFQILKDDAVKGLNSICQQIWKTTMATRLEKTILIPVPNKGITKTNKQTQKTTIQLHSLHILTKLCLNAFKLGFSSN